MPSPRHPCAVPECEVMLARKEAMYCKKHVPHTKEWVAKQAASTRGQKRSAEICLKLSIARRGRRRLNPNSPPGEIDRICEYCQAPFSVQKPSAKQRFCSIDCGYNNRKGEQATNWLPSMPYFTCLICGETKRCRTRSLHQVFCSYSCKGVWCMRNQQTANTNIEIVMREALEARGMHLLRQVKVGRFTVDIVLPEYNVAVSCDGDFWHALDTTNRDARQTKALESAGLKVFRFWGSDILLNVNKCVQQIISFLPHNGDTQHPLAINPLNG